MSMENRILCEELQKELQLSNREMATIIEAIMEEERYRKEVR